MLLLICKDLKLLFQSNSITVRFHQLCGFVVELSLQLIASRFKFLHVDREVRCETTNTRTRMNKMLGLRLDLAPDLFPNIQTPEAADVQLTCN